MQRYLSPTTLYFSILDGEANRLIDNDKLASLHPDTAVISEWRIGDFDVEVGHSLGTVPVEQSDFVVCPDSVAQVIKQLNHRQRLIS